MGTWYQVFLVDFRPTDSICEIITYNFTSPNTFQKTVNHTKNAVTVIENGTFHAPGIMVLEQPEYSAISSG